MASQALRLAASLSAATRDATNGRRFIVHNPVFSPKDTVPVKCGSETVSVYPTCSPTNPMAELSHAFYTTSSALEATNIPPKQQFQFLTDRMGLTSQAISIRQDLFDEFRTLWQEPANMELINYRNDEGVAINNCLNAVGLLKPIQDGPAAGCRPSNIKYMTVRSTVNFVNGLHHRFVHTIELPVQIAQVQRSANPNLVLNTYIGNDPLLMSRQEFQDEILILLFHQQPLN